MECSVHLVTFILRHSTSFRENRPSLPFIDLYVPALTPWTNGSEATLEIAANKILVLLCRVYTSTAIIREDSKMSSRGRGGIISI
jgi:hypothetical protein